MKKRELQSSKSKLPINCPQYYLFIMDTLLLLLLLLILLLMLILLLDRPKANVG